MTVPKDAKFIELIAGGIALWDVTHLLPTQDKPQRTRDVSGIDTLFMHHSGALGKAGFAGLLGSAKYMVGTRDFPSCGYTFWISKEEERDDENRLVVYRASQDDERDWHSGGKANDRGIACALQGNTNTTSLSFFQEECLEGFIPWAAGKYGLVLPEGLCWHSDAARRGGRAKAQCPGKYAEAWLRGYLRGVVTPYL